MNIEIFIVLALVTVFLISCCGLIKKIRKHEEETGHVIAISQVQVSSQFFNNHAYRGGIEDTPNGIFPSGLAPPPYIEAELLPPKYEDIIKSPDYAVIQVEQNIPIRVHQYNPSADLLTLAANRPHNTY